MKKYNYTYSNSAFTIVELVISLVVIALLVSAITGGAVLVQHARTLILIDEIRTYVQATKNFRQNKKRWPGDLRRMGKIGLNSGQTYNNDSFGNPYISSNYNYGIPTDSVGPFIELFQTGYLDFEPRKFTPSNENLDWNNGGAPTSKVIEHFQCYYQYNPTATGDGIPLPNIGYIGSAITCNYKTISPKNYVPLDSMRNVDKKLDDGIFNKGIVRGYCYKTGTDSDNYVGYNQTEPKKYKCSGLTIHLENNNL